MTYTLKFSQHMLDLLNQALMELPKKHADPFIQAINVQIKEQLEKEKSTNELPESKE